MRLSVLGSGTGVPSPLRGPSGYLVEAAGSTLLWDCGPGTMERLVRFGHDWRVVDHIFLTHHHPDHCADLVAFLFANNWHLERRETQPLQVIGPRGTRQFVDRMYEAFPGLRWQKFRLDVTEWDGEGEWGAPGWVVRGHRVDHGDLEAMALRLECEGRSLVYSGDTAETPRIVQAARGADTLLIECAVPDELGPHPVHLTPGAAGRVAQAAGAGRVILTHFYPQCEGVDVRGQCAAVCDGPVLLAGDGLSFEI